MQSQDSGQNICIADIDGFVALAYFIQRQVHVISVEVEFWDESPKGLPLPRQNACCYSLFGCKERKDVTEKRVG